MPPMFQSLPNVGHPLASDINPTFWDSGEFLEMAVACLPSQVGNGQPVRLPVQMKVKCFSVMLNYNVYLSDTMNG